MSGENVANIQKGTADRISELPEFILHNILAMLDTKAACRASVLSKRWFDAWSSIPVLDFQPRYFQKYGDGPLYKYDDEHFVGFIDKTMERYFMREYRITKMYLMLPKIDEKLKSLIDKWIMIAVHNQIQRLEIQIRGYPNKISLPEILFRAKSLKYLKCENVVLPFYETMELVSLEYLTFNLEIVYEDMLQRILSSCPLVELEITYDNCLKKISLPCNGGVESRGSGMMHSDPPASQLQKFVYRNRNPDISWPWNMNVVALKSLRKLVFDGVPITDDIVSELSYGLVVLESLTFLTCSMLECINISSNSLKQLRIARSFSLKKATIDAPNLLEFRCGCKLDASLLLIRARAHCSAQFFKLHLDSVTTVWLVKLKKFLLETNFFKSLVIDLFNLEIEVEHDHLMNVGTGVPYKLRELKLHGSSIWGNPTKSSLVAFMNGLFWCCHPDVLSMTTNLQDSAAKAIAVVDDNGD